MSGDLDDTTTEAMTDSERLRLIERSVRDYALITMDTHLRITGWNAGAEDILGWQTSETLGQHGAIIFTPEDRAAGVVEQEHRRAENTGRAEDKRWHLRKNETRFWASGIMTALRNDDGELRGFVKILRDATLRHQEKESRETLLKSLESERARLISLFMQAPAFIAVLHGPDHTFEMANPLYFQLVNHRDILGKPVREALPEVEGQGFIELLDDVYRTGQPFVGKDVGILLQTTEDGPLQQRYLDFIYQPLLAEDGSTAGIFVHGVDFTEYRQAQAEIETLNVRLRRSVQETHHRIKNNLQVISALADLQIEQTDTVPVAALRRIGQHTRSLAAIHDLLTHEAKTNIEAEHISVRDMMDQLVPLLRETAGGRTLHYTAQDFRLPVREGASLALLVSELVSNAIKHGHRAVEIMLDATDDMARLEVRDDGPGFAPDFDWRRAANTGLSLIDSTGRHDLHGAITYANSPQGGARVVVEFPLINPNIR